MNITCSCGARCIDDYGYLWASSFNSKFNWGVSDTKTSLRLDPEWKSLSSILNEYDPVSFFNSWTWRADALLQEFFHCWCNRFLWSQWYGHRKETSIIEYTFTGILMTHRDRTSAWSVSGKLLWSVFIHANIITYNSGNGQLTYEEQKSHFTAWALMKSPLLIVSDHLLHPSVMHFLI